MLRDVEMHDAATDMRQHDYHEQDATREGRHREEIHRRGAREVIREKRLPRLRRPAGVRFQQTDTVRSETWTPSVCNSP